MTSIRGIALGLAAAIIALAPGLSQARSLEEIKQSGTLRVAVAMGVPLFAFADKTMQPTGSDVETAKKIAEDLGVKLQLVEITNAARVPTIQTGKADILVANLGITDERKKAVDFTVPYATLNIIVAGTGSEAIGDYAALAGKRIGVTRATVNDQLVTQNAPNAQVVRFEDDATLITAVTSGQVNLVSTQSAVLSAMNERKGGDPLEVKFVQRELNLGIALPKGEETLREWLNTWIRENAANGKLNALFKSFHNRDLPADLTERG
ncbi:transporter substrate-binding domain-containing protein [Aureimonas psammosilenae]|uniref:transporter substrate-binding domain-containing protein n=1 Tax=Aureimonas psammosilenae TaxID=2495496 RepID=UPI0012613076|nr:transporter substrate-binding domain-containing protein [Aureimonas psammosilenae]